MLIEVIQLAYGTGIPSPLPGRQVEYYRAVALLMFRTEAGSEAKLRAPSETLAISAEHSIAAQAIADLIVERLKERAAQYVIIDLGGPDVTDVPRLNVLSGLENAVEQLLSNFAPLEIGILVPVELHVRDTAWPAFKQICRDIRVRVISAATGTTLGKWFKDNPLSSNEYVKLLSAAQTQPLDIIQQKLIRKIGHYYLPENNTFFHFFYDGSNCIDAISITIQTRLTEPNAKNIEKIYYDTRVADWFGIAVNSALKWLNLSNLAHEIKGDTLIPDEHMNDRTIILLPIVRTGTTLREIFGAREIAAWPSVWSLLSTEGKSIKKPKQYLNVTKQDGKAIRVRYALKVQRLATYTKNIFEDMRHAAIDPRTEDISEPFGVAAMWGMILDAGLQLEKPVPPDRKCLGFVPSMGHLAESNGTLIAAKVSAILEKKFGWGLSPNVIFFCPEEEHAERLIAALGSLARHDAITIHRQVIQFFSNGALEVGTDNDLRKAVLDYKTKQKTDAISEGNLDNLLAKLGYLQDQVARASAEDAPQVVIVDEFNYSGNTIRGMYELANWFDLDVRCSISLASFKKNDEASYPIPHIPLYELNLDRLVSNIDA